MSDVFAAVVSAVRPKYMKGFEDMTIRRRLLLAMLRRRGRIEKNASGDQCVYQLKFSKPNSSQYADGSAVDYSNHNPFRRLKLDWRAHINTDTITMMQKAINTGDNQLINLYQDKINNIMSGLTEDFSGELYKDGHAAGRENAVHGLETYLGDDGNTVVGDIIAKPSDTVGIDALSTVPGNEGGSWTSALGTSPNATLANDWPNGSGDREYDYNSPKLLNWSSNAWGTSAVTWEANCWRVISQALTWLHITSGVNAGLCILPSHLYQGYKNHHETLRRINIPHQEAQDLGFGNTLNQDGCAIQMDFDVPVNTGYVLNVEDLTLTSLMNNLFWSLDSMTDGSSAMGIVKGIDMRTLSNLMAAGFFGNLKAKARNLGKMLNYAAA